MNLYWLGSGLISLSWIGITGIFGEAPLPLGALLLAAGIALVLLAAMRDDSAAGAPWRPRSRLGFALLVVSCQALLQLLMIPLLILISSRVHRVDWVAPILWAALRALGIPAGLSEGTVFYEEGGHVLPFTCTLEKLGFFVVALLVSGYASLCILRSRSPRLGVLSRTAALLAGYAFLRYLALILIFVHSQDPRLENVYLAAPTRILHDPLIVVLSWIPCLLLLAWWRRGEASRLERPPGERPLAPRPLLLGAGLFLLFGAGTLGFFQFQDPGEPKDGRILLDEAHSPFWERTDVALDRETYGRNTLYTYRSMLDLLQKHHAVEVNHDRAYTSELLADCDVLILKTAPLPFGESEVEAIVDFVEGGGGLFLIGDHTDLLGINSHLNQVATRFGIRFEKDSCNRLDTGQLHSFAPHPLLRHPAMAGVASFGFMTSCSLAAPWWAENAMVCLNTFSDGVDYSDPNLFGNVRVDTEESFGAFLMAAAVKQGAGRVLAFSDSTVLSSFSLGYGGRREFLLSAVDYLNRRNVWGYLPNRALGLLAGLALVVGVPLMSRRGRCGYALAIGSTALGALAMSGLLALASPAGEPPQGEGFRYVTFLEGHGDFVLPPPLGYSRVPDEKAFDGFLVWTQRMGRFPRVSDSIDEALEGSEALVLINPTRELSPASQRRIIRWVAGGGRLLVMDSLLNRRSSANQLLRAFGLELVCDVFPCPGGPSEGPPASGHPELSTRVSPEAMVLRLSVSGGDPLYAAADGQVLIGETRIGEGRVIAVAESSTFSRACMGTQTEEPEKDSPLRRVYELEYQLFDWLFAEQP